MDTKRTFVVATDHTRKFEYCARSHISSPLPVGRRHQIMPSPRSATGPQRPCKRLYRHFPGLGILTKIMNTKSALAFSFRATDADLPDDFEKGCGNR